MYIPYQSKKFGRGANLNLKFKKIRESEGGVVVDLSGITTAELEAIDRASMLADGLPVLMFVAGSIGFVAGLFLIGIFTGKNKAIEPTIISTENKYSGISNVYYSYIPFGGARRFRSEMPIMVNPDMRIKCDEFGQIIDESEAYFYFTIKGNIEQWNKDQTKVEIIDVKPVEDLEPVFVLSSVKTFQEFIDEYKRQKSEEINTYVKEALDDSVDEYAEVAV